MAFGICTAQIQYDVMAATLRLIVAGIVLGSVPSVLVLRLIAPCSASLRLGTRHPHRRHPDLIWRSNLRRLRPRLARLNKPPHDRPQV
jgi:hypothetical protein